MITMIVITVAVLLFVLAFVTKRRFGVLGLGLAAGALIASSWSSWLADLLTKQNIGFAQISNPSLAAIILIILPSLILLAGGPRYHKPLPAIIGSIGYALMGFLLTIISLQGTLDVTDGTVKEMIHFAKDYQPGLVALGVAIAVIDMFLAHSKEHGHHKKHKE